MKEGEVDSNAVVGEAGIGGGERDWGMTSGKTCKANVFEGV